MCEQFGTCCQLCKRGVKHGDVNHRTRKGEIWRKHWSESMGARTPQHGREVAARCMAAGVDVKFEHGTYGRIKVNSRKHQKQLMPVVHADVGRMVNFDDY